MALQIYVDELHRRDGGSQLNFNNCKITPDQISGWRNELPSWNNLYVNIRACNKFLANAEKLPDDGVLDRWCDQEKQDDRRSSFFKGMVLYATDKFIWRCTHN